MAQLLRTQSYPPAGKLHFIDTDSIEDDVQGVFGEEIGCGAPWSPSAGAHSEPFGEALNVTMLDSDERFTYTGQCVQPYAHAARQEMPPLLFVNMGADIGRASDEVAFAHILTQPTHLNSLYKNDMLMKPACVSSPFAAFAGQLPAEFVEDSEKKPAASYLSFPSSEANNLIDLRKTSGPRGYLCVVEVQPAKPAQPPLQEPYIGKSAVYPSLLHTPNLRMDQPESPLPTSKCSEMAAPSPCARASAPWKGCTAGTLSNNVAAMACASMPLPTVRNLLFEPAISCAGGAAPFSPMEKPATPPESPSASGLFCTSSILDRSSSCAEPEVASAADRAEHMSSAGQQASSPQGVVAASGAQRASKRLASTKRRRATDEFETDSEEEIEQEYEQGVAVGVEGDETDEDYVGHAEVVGGIGTGRSKRIKRAPAPRMLSYGARGNDRCRDCGATQTPQWRSGPLGPRTLCNACGVRYTKWMNSKRGRAAAAVTVLPPIRCEAPAAPLRGNQPLPAAWKPKVQRKKQCVGV